MSDDDPKFDIVTDGDGVRSLQRRAESSEAPTKTTTTDVLAKIAGEHYWFVLEPGRCHGCGERLPDDAEIVDWHRRHVAAVQAQALADHRGDRGISVDIRYLWTAERERDEAKMALVELELAIRDRRDVERAARGWQNGYRAGLAMAARIVRDHRAGPDPRAAAWQTAHDDFCEEPSPWCHTHHTNPYGGPT